MLFTHPIRAAILKHFCLRTPFKHKNQARTTINLVGMRRHCDVRAPPYLLERKSHCIQYNLLPQKSPGWLNPASHHPLTQGNEPPTLERESRPHMKYYCVNEFGSSTDTRSWRLEHLTLDEVQERFSPPAPTSLDLFSACCCLDGGWRGSTTRSMQKLQKKTPHRSLATIHNSIPETL